MRALDAIRDTGKLSDICNQHLVLRCQIYYESSQTLIVNPVLSVCRSPFLWAGWIVHRCHREKIADLASTAAKFPQHLSRRPKISYWHSAGWVQQSATRVRGQWLYVCVYCNTRWQTFVCVSVLMSLLTSVGFWWSRISGIPRSSNWTCFCVSNHNFVIYLQLLSFANPNKECWSCSRNNLLLLLLFQCEVSQRQQHSGPVPPVCSKRPHQYHGACKLLLLPDPNHAPHLCFAAAQQAAQKLPGAEELQRQLQHSGQFVLKLFCKGNVEEKVVLPVVKVPMDDDWTMLPKLQRHVTNTPHFII